MKYFLSFVLMLCSMSAAEKPNVILILADDLGIADTSIGGSKYYQTPNFEKLAGRGIYFTNAYTASPLCSPTRSSILTGMSPARTGITSPRCHLPVVTLKASVQKKANSATRQLGVDGVSRLDTKYETLGKVFKKAGYKTAHFGKWHLGKAPYSALEHGFDIDIPNWHGPGPAGSYVAPWKFPNFKENYPKEHIEDRMGDEIVKFLEQNKDKPFYINYWQFSVHGPFDAKEELIEKYRKTLDPKNPQNCPTYAAMVQSFDDNVGKVMNTLDRLGLSENTIIVFYSDNGGNMYNLVDGTTVTSNAPYRGGKASHYDGGIRVPAVVVWPGKTKTGIKSDALIQSEDIYKSLIEMAGLECPKNQGQDSISFVPVLKGEQGKRDAVFTYFPHSPRVPDVVPPSVTIRKGDWKLIRAFHDNMDQSHRYELYNVSKDVGERQNVAGQNPEIVKELDKRIEDFLVNTKAVVPEKNPSYKGQGIQKAKGWESVGYVNLSAKPEGFQIRSFGDNPMTIQTYEKLNIKPGEYTFQYKIRSLSATGKTSLQWGDTKDVKFSNLTDTGLWEEKSFEFTAESPVKQLKLQIASSQGVTHIEWMKLLDNTGNEVKSWSGIQAKKKKVAKNKKK